MAVITGAAAAIGATLSGSALALGATGLGLAGSMIEGRKARKEQEKARRIEQKRARLQGVRNAISAVGEAQRARAQIIAQGEVQGVSGSSAVAGGAGAIQSSAGGNIAFGQEMFNLQTRASNRLMKANIHANRARGFSNISSLVGGFI